MTKKLVLGLIGAGLVMGMTVPAFAQSDRSRGANQNSAGSYAQDNGRNNQRSNDKNGRYYEQSSDRRSDYRRGAETQTFATRYRATILLTENAVRGRRGTQNVCTVSVRGPQSRLVPKQRLRRIAKDNCSRRARIRITA